MSEILKITTPVINKSQVVGPKSPIDPTSPFTVTDPSRVIRTHNQRELLKQNTGSNQNGDAPVLLMNLLKDPAVTVTYLKNIFMLEEIFKLLPANNKTVTTEIEQIFQSLIMQPQDIEKSSPNNKMHLLFSKVQCSTFYAIYQNLVRAHQPHNMPSLPF